LIIDSITTALNMPKQLSGLNTLLTRGRDSLLVIGDIGTGKTIVARRLLDELDETRYEAALLVVLHSSITSDWLMGKIAMQLGVENPNNSEALRLKSGLPCDD